MGFRALLLATSAGLPMVVVATSVLGQSPAPAGSAHPPAVAPQTSTTGSAAKPRQPNVMRPPVRREVQPQPQQRIVKRAPTPSTTLPVVTGSTVPAPEPPVTGQAVTGQAVTGEPAGQAGTAPNAGAEPATSTAAPAQPPVDMWSPEAITAAKQHCDAVLKGVDAVYVTEEPIKQGGCGAPAVVRLMSVGKGPEIVLSPPAVVTCDMVAAMAKWVKADVQPLARTNLGSPIVKIETMSSYSCRNAYGRSRTNLSEHGRANALDIGSFVTASNEPVKVLTSWGLTNREVRAIAAKAEAEKVAAAKAAAAKAMAQQKSAPVATGSTPQARRRPRSPASPSPNRPPPCRGRWACRRRASWAVPRMPQQRRRRHRREAPLAARIREADAGHRSGRGNERNPAAEVPSCRARVGLQALRHRTGSGSQQRAQEPLPRRHGAASVRRVLRVGWVKPRAFSGMRPNRKMYAKRARYCWVAISLRHLSQKTGGPEGVPPVERETSLAGRAAPARMPHVHQHSMYR